MIGRAFQAMQLAKAMRVPGYPDQVDMARRLESTRGGFRAPAPEPEHAVVSRDTEFAIELNA